MGRVVTPQSCLGSLVLGKPLRVPFHPRPSPRRCMAPAVSAGRSRTRTGRRTVSSGVWCARRAMGPPTETSTTSCAATARPSGSPRPRAGGGDRRGRSRSTSVGATSTASCAPRAGRPCGLPLSRVPLRPLYRLMGRHIVAHPPSTTPWVDLSRCSLRYSRGHALQLHKCYHSSQCPSGTPNLPSPISVRFPSSSVSVARYTVTLWTHNECRVHALSSRLVQDHPYPCGFKIRTRSTRNSMDSK